MLSVNWLERWSFDEEISLWPLDPLVIDAEGNFEGVAEDNGAEGGEKLAVFGIIPIGGELIRGDEGESCSVEGVGFGLLEPDADDLFGEF